MGYSINYSAYSSNFAIPTAVVDDIKSTNSDHLKVILTILYNPSRYYSPALIGSLLKISDKTVDDAIRYWIARGVLVSDDEVTPVPSVISKETKPIEPAISKSVNSFNVASTPNIATTPKATQKATPKVNVNEEEAMFLLQTIESFFNRPISSTEKNNITAIYQTLNLPLDVIIMAFQYCQTIDKLSVPYAQKICVSWMEKGINTHEKVEEFFMTMSDKNTQENQIKMVFGIGRALSDTEKVFVDRWFNEFMFDISVIKLAYDKAVNQINNAPFAYINKILDNWYQSGYRSVDEITKSSGYNRRADSNKTSSFDLDDIKSLMDDNLPKF